MVAANRRYGVGTTESGLASLLAASRGHPRTALPTVASVVTTVAALYFGREVFLPIAVALLLTFAIAPVVSWLKRAGMPRLPAVIASVLGAFAILILAANTAFNDFPRLASILATDKYVPGQFSARVRSGRRSVVGFTGLR